MTMSNTQMTGSNAMQERALIVRALTTLEYAPIGAVEGAAARMARAPQLVTSLFNYVMGGKPPIDFARQTPAELFVGLPGGHSVASLVRDFELAPVGAFLMASELVANTVRAQEMLTAMIEEGYFKTMPDGVRVQLYPPISSRYPCCPNCARHWVRTYATCPRCGYGQFEAQLDRGEIPDEILSEYLAAGAVHPRAQVASQGSLLAACSRCNKPARPASKFCVYCGGPVRTLEPAVAPAPQAQQAPVAGGLYCVKCGGALRETTKFCTGCGAPVVKRPPKPVVPTCPSCGSVVDPAANFCEDCGWVLGG